MSHDHISWLRKATSDVESSKENVNYPRVLSKIALNIADLWLHFAYHHHITDFCCVSIPQNTPVPPSPASRWNLTKNASNMPHYHVSRLKKATSVVES